MERESPSEKGAARGVVVILIVALIVVGAGYVYMRVQQQNVLEGARSRAEQHLEAMQTQAVGVARDLALDLGLTLGAVLADEVAGSQTGVLSNQLAAIVRGRRVTGIIVLGTEGTVVATTDLRYSGRTLSDAATVNALNVTEPTVVEATVPGHVEVDAPLRLDGQRVGTVRVFVDLGALAADLPGVSSPPRLP